MMQLPGAGLNSKSIRFLHHPVILNYHFYIADENILNLAPHTNAVLASYKREEGQALVLLVSYPDAEAAAEACARFSKTLTLALKMIHQWYQQVHS